MFHIHEEIMTVMVENIFCLLEAAILAIAVHVLGMSGPVLNINIVLQPDLVGCVVCYSICMMWPDMILKQKC